LGRINSQWTDEQRVLKSDYVIINIDSEIAKKTEEILKILKIKQGFLNVNVWLIDCHSYC
jgi:dephospho-CoA kinase